MEIKVPEELAKRIGAKVMRTYGVEENSFSWRKWAPLQLAKMSRKQAEQFRDLAKPHEKIRGVGVLLADIETWLRVLDDGTAARARSVTNAAALLREVLRRIPGHRVFERAENASDVLVCYYVERVGYVPPQRNERSTTPEHVEMELVYEEFGGRKKETVVFWPGDCRGITPIEALVRKGYYLETPERRTVYLAEVERFNGLVRQVGLQCLATGTGTDNLDGNGKSQRDSWWHNRTNTVVLARDGVPSRVVVDLFREEEKEVRDRETHIDTWFWGPSVGRDGDDDDDEGVVTGKKDTRKDLPREDVEVSGPPVIEVPIHPYVAVFDLTRHMRLRVHVSNLTPYVYDRNLHERLVLPADVKALVAMLLGARGSFADIVSGKSGGAIVMCAGSPGTGKTLTAQVYAETMGRPLYSVQAAQLGLSPEELEDELLKVFARSQRWGAILLVDEADVYVRARGDDLQQNAIVGVLLRVLEHYAGVLFLTTNRASTIDDAVASRCMARIDYSVPTKEEQARIWRILADGAGVALDPKVVAEVVEAYPKLSGRDVKNLLKLANLVATATEQPITAATIAYVKRFKPTQSDEDEPAPGEPAPPPPGLLEFAKAPRGRVRRASPTSPNGGAS